MVFHLKKYDFSFSRSAKFNKRLSTPFNLFAHFHIPIIYVIGMINCTKSKIKGVLLILSRLSLFARVVYGLWWNSPMLLIFNSVIPSTSHSNIIIYFQFKSHHHIVRFALFLLVSDPNLQDYSTTAVICRTISPLLCFQSVSGTESGYTVTYSVFLPFLINREYH
jgi:hypothetical protein